MQQYYVLMLTENILLLCWRYSNDQVFKKNDNHFCSTLYESSNILFNQICNPSIYHLCRRTFIFVFKCMSISYALTNKMNYMYEHKAYVSKMYYIVHADPLS